MSFKEFSEKIKIILYDINQDKEINKKRQDEFSEQGYVHPKYEIPVPGIKRGQNYGIFPLVFPQLAGSVFGFALARMFEGGFWLYIILGVLMGISAGTLNSIDKEKINPKYAVLRNIIIFFIMTLLIEFIFFLPLLIIFNF